MVEKTFFFLGPLSSNFSGRLAQFKKFKSWFPIDWEEYPERILKEGAESISSPAVADISSSGWSRAAATAWWMSWKHLPGGGGAVWIAASLLQVQPYGFTLQHRLQAGVRIGTALCCLVFIHTDMAFLPRTSISPGVLYKRIQVAYKVWEWKEHKLMYTTGI